MKIHALLFVVVMGAAEAFALSVIMPPQPAPGKIVKSAEPARLLGAEEAMRSVAAREEAERVKKKKTFVPDAANFELADAIREFKQNSGTLTPENAAEAWLVLFDKFHALGDFADRTRWWYSGDDKLYDDPNFMNLVAAIPHPDAWPRIRELLDKRQAEQYSPRLAFVQLLMAWLANDREAAKSIYDELAKATTSKDEKLSSEYSFYSWLKSRLFGDDKDENDDEKNIPKSADEIVAYWWSRIDNHKSYDYYDVAKFPDFAKDVPAGEAKKMVRAILVRRLEINGFENADTLALAQKTALELGSELPAPAWYLVTASPDGEEVFNLYKKRFPNEYNSSAWEIMTGYMLDKGRIDAAVDALAQYVLTSDKDKRQSNYIQRFSRFKTRAESAEAKVEFYKRLRKQIPEFPANDDYVVAAVKSGRAAEAEAVILEKLENAELAPNIRYDYFKLRLLLLDESERIAEALALRKTILGDATLAKYFNEGGFELAVQTANIAACENDADTQNFALDFALAIHNHSDHRWSYIDKVPMLAGALERGGRIADVESLLVLNIRGKHESYAIENLTRLYAENGRMEDVVFLLENAPWWGESRDVLDFLERYGTPSDTAKHAARALFETGRRDEVRALVTEIMVHIHSLDWTYELLLKMTEDENDLEGFVAHMDVLFARDAFEERPFIWKAEALRRMGRLEEAEQAARRALEIDPTDGDQPAGDRVRGYAVLGAILDELGRADEAQVYKDVVKSVRIAEEGDKFLETGMLKQSLERFAEAEKVFPLAYCVQWRLAERLREMGRIEEAVKHYEIAFENMPEQFGRVASLCFGCEGMFHSKESVGAAERVLSRLMEKPNVRPAAYFIMGEFCEHRKRNDKALGYYVKAAGADPYYVDALKKILSLADGSKRDDIDTKKYAGHLVALDPFERHTGMFAGNGAGWDVLWARRNAKLQVLPPAPESIFPLTANIARLKKWEEENAEKSRYSSSRPYTRGIYPPAETIARKSIVTTLRDLDKLFVPIVNYDGDGEEGGEGDGVNYDFDW